jgi:hypothetical protein
MAVLPTSLASWHPDLSSRHRIVEQDEDAPIVSDRSVQRRHSGDTPDNNGNHYEELQQRLNAKLKDIRLITDGD